MKYGELKNYIGGRFIEHPGEFMDVFSPHDGSLIARVPVSKKSDLDMAVSKAAEVFSMWSGIPKKEFRFFIAINHYWKKI